MSTNLIHQVALSQVPGIGPVLAKNLIAYCGSAEAIFYENVLRLQKIPGIGQVAAESLTNFNDFERIEAEVKYMEKNEIQSCFFTDKSYPFRLKQIPDAPIMLYHKGCLPDPFRPTLGVIGTRKCSPFAREKTYELLENLLPYNPCIISGLAYGVDAHAHKAAVQFGLQTIGVLGSGLKRVYPGSHQGLSKKMIEHGGGLITEFLHDAKPDRENFPKRNRIVAGLVDAIIVVETPLKGGSMITANLAFGYDREVMALPVRAGDQTYGGTNALIKRNQAHLVESAEDIAAVLNWDLKNLERPKQAQLPLDLKPEERTIFDALKQIGTMDLEALGARTQMGPGKLSMVLLEMEFRNLVRNLPGKRYELV